MILNKINCEYENQPLIVLPTNLAQAVGFRPVGAGRFMNPSC